MMRKFFKTSLLATMLATVSMMSALPAIAGEAQNGKQAGDVIKDQDRLRDGSCQDTVSASKSLETVLMTNDFVPRQRQRQPDKEKEHTNKP